MVNALSFVPAEALKYRMLRYRIWYDRVCRKWRVTSQYYSASAQSYELVVRALQAHVRGVDRFCVYKSGNSWIAERYNHPFESWITPVSLGGWVACMSHACMRLREIEQMKGQKCVGCGKPVVPVGRLMLVSNARRLAQLCWVCFHLRAAIREEQKKEAANKKEESDDD